VPTEPCSTLFSALKGRGGNKATGTVASPAPPTGSAATLASTVAAPGPAPMVGTAAAPAPAAYTRAELENQPVLVSVAPIQRKKYAKKPVHPMKDDNEPGPSQEQKKEVETEDHPVTVPE